MLTTVLEARSIKSLFYVPVLSYGIFSGMKGGLKLPSVLVHCKFLALFSLFVTSSWIASIQLSVINITKKKKKRERDDRKNLLPSPKAQDLAYMVWRHAVQSGLIIIAHNILMPSAKLRTVEINTPPLGFAKYFFSSEDKTVISTASVTSLDVDSPDPLSFLRINLLSLYFL